MDYKSFDQPLEIFSKYANVISASMDVKQLAINVQSVLESFIDVEYTGLYFYDDKSHELKLLYAKNFTAEELINAEKTAMERHPGHVFRTKKHILIKDTTKSKVSSSSKRSFKIFSRLYIPILIEDKCVGTFGLASSEKNKFSDDDISVLYFIGSLAAMRYISIQKEILNIQQLKENISLSTSLKQIERFATTIQQSKSVTETIWSVAEKVVTELGFNDCVVYLFDENKEFLLQKASHGVKKNQNKDVLGPVKIKLGKGIIGTVAKTGIGEIISDTSLDSRYIVDDANRLSEITVPIVHNNEVIGVIDSEHPDKNYFTIKDLEILHTISAMTATKIIQTQLHSDLMNHQLNLENTISERTEELSEKAQKIEDQNIELKKLSLFPEHNPSPVIELDFEYNIIYTNNGAKKHLKDTPLFNPNDPDRRKYEALLSKTKKGKKTGVYELNEGFWINKRHYDMNLYIDNEFKILRIYLNDVTEIRRIQNELTKALKKVNIQQTELKDSIKYTKHLQQAILPLPKANKEEYMESLVLYKPKDIIGGDFFGREDKDENVIFFAADCTGHGVPGALLTFVCFNALNIATTSSPKLNPAKILNKARDVVINTFEKSQETVNDGMDIALCVLNRKTNELTYSGANSRIYIIKKIDVEMRESDVYNESHYVQSTKGDPQPIGNYFNMKPFTNHKFKLTKGDIITVFSDGYPDQFGGKKNKKYGYKRFKNTLLSIHDKPIIEQKKILNNKFMEWKGEYEQIDDVLILQIRV